MTGGGRVIGMQGSLHCGSRAIPPATPRMTLVAGDAASRRPPGVVPWLARLVLAPGADQGLSRSSSETAMRPRLHSDALRTALRATSTDDTLLDVSAESIPVDFDDGDRPTDPDGFARERAMALLGRVISERYRIDALLGMGGMGAVYRGYHLLLKKPVAIKVLHANIKKPARACGPLSIARRSRGPTSSTPTWPRPRIGGSSTTAPTSSSWSTSPGRRCTTSSTGSGSRWRAPSTSPGRSPRPSRPRTPGASSTAISSPATSCWPRAPGTWPSSSTSASPRCRSIRWSARPRLPGRRRARASPAWASSSVPSRTSRPRPPGAWIASTRGPICMRSVLSSTRCSRGGTPSTPQRPRSSSPSTKLQAPPPLGKRGPHVPPELAAIVMRLLAKEPAARHASSAELIEELDALGLAPILPGSERPPVPRADAVRETHRPGRPPPRLQRPAGTPASIAPAHPGARDPGAGRRHRHVLLGHRHLGPRGGEPPDRAEPRPRAAAVAASHGALIPAAPPPRVGARLVLKGGPTP